MGVVAQRAVPSENWRRGAIILVILGAHGLLITGLLLMRLVEQDHRPAAPPETMMILVPSSRPPEKSSHTKARQRTGIGVPLPDYRWVGPGGPPSSSAITILRIPPYRAEGPPPCPKILRPGTPEWEARCGSAVASAGESGEGGAIGFSRELDLRYRGFWEAERRARNKPVEVPCTYLHTFPTFGGPPPPPARMVDIGCAAKQLFGPRP